MDFLGRLFLSALSLRVCVTCQCMLSYYLCVEFSFMWFRNLLMYRLTSDTAVDLETLETALASKPALPCGRPTLSIYDLVDPFGTGDDALLVHSGVGFFLD